MARDALCFSQPWPRMLRRHLVSGGSTIGSFQKQKPWVREWLRAGRAPSPGPSAVCGPPSTLCLSRPRPGCSVCCPRSRLYAPADIAGACPWLCRSPSTVVASGQHCPDRSPGSDGRLASVIARHYDKTIAVTSALRSRRDRHSLPRCHVWHKRHPHPCRLGKLKCIPASR